MMISKMKRRKKEKQLVIILISLLFVLGGIICVRSLIKEDKNNEVEFYSSDDETFTIKTKYCDLQYPVKWEEFTEVVIIDEEQYIVEFYVKTSDTNVHLFDLSFGQDDEFYLGTLKAESEVDVYLKNYTVDKEVVSDEEFNRCCSMEEDINILISKLIENYDFQISK